MGITVRASAPRSDVGLSIREVAAKTGITTHTLRYYERIGLVLRLDLDPVGIEEGAPRRCCHRDGQGARTRAEIDARRDPQQARHVRSRARGRGHPRPLWNVRTLDLRLVPLP